MSDDLNDLLLQLQADVDRSEAFASSLESKLSGSIIPQGADLEIQDRINFHYGVIHGLRQAIFAVYATEA